MKNRKDIFTLDEKIEMRREVCDWLIRWVETIKYDLEHDVSEELIANNVSGLEIAIMHFKRWSDEIREEKRYEN